MIEEAFYDLAAQQPAIRRTQAFTRDDDAHWAGVVELAPGDRFESRADERTDIFILQGALADGTGEPASAGGFLSLRQQAVFTAGGQGAVLFVYRETSQSAAPATTMTAQQRPWRNARVAGMRVASLVARGYQTALVEWGPGTHVHQHDHAFGEEIFVLEGVLHSQGRRYPAGSWLRLHPGATHTPGAEHHALIILRNSHLRDRA